MSALIEGPAGPHIYRYLSVGLLAHGFWSQLFGKQSLAPWNLCSHRQPWWQQLSPCSCGLCGRRFSSLVFCLICPLLGSIDHNGLRGLECTTSLFMGIASCMGRRIRRYVYFGIYQSQVWVADVHLHYLLMAEKSKDTFKGFKNRKS
jgi:hypothetical protein